MTLTESRASNQAGSAGDEATKPSRWRGVTTVAAIAVVVSVLAQLPLIRNHIFYYWDDSAAAALPDWYLMGEQLRAGYWPTIAPDLWMGGNFAAESVLGLFNPLVLINSVVISLLPDLAVAATLLKTEFLVILAIGVYLLCRDFGAGRRAAAVVAVAMPFAGYTLYFDASTWVTGLMAFAHLPYVWWALRKFARRELNPLVPIAIGYLTMTIGNPYGAVGVAVIVVAVAVEQMLARDWKAVRNLVLSGLVIGASTIVVYLPLVGSSAVSWRVSDGIRNDGALVPNLGDLFGMSAPTYQPQYPVFASNMLSFPSFYLAWFILPLAPWLCWSVLRKKVRENASLIVFGVIYLLLLLGPSSIWLFRWPSRLTEYVYLPVGVAVAIVLSMGLKRTYPARRALISALIVLAGGYLSWASTPQHAPYHVLATALVLGLVAAAVLIHRRRPALFSGVLVLGTAVFLGIQALLYPANNNVTPWYFPHDVAAMKARFEHRFVGNTLQIVDIYKAGREMPLTPDGLWNEAITANVIHTAGVDTLNSYTGIGYVKFASALCMNYYGATCPEAFKVMWQDAENTGVNWADILRLRTIVVDSDFTVTQDPDDPQAPGMPIPVANGWSVAEKSRLMTVYRRDDPLTWPDGRLSWAESGVQVSANVRVGETGERLVYRGGGRAVFATLAWPGYEAKVDGKNVDVRQGPGGLIEVNLPPSAPAGSTLEISFTPPGYRYGIPLMIGVLIIGVGWGVAWEVMRRRRRAAVAVPGTD